jgi:hypothetical protein
MSIINHPHIDPKHFGQVLPCFERQTVGNGGQACGPNTASVALTSGHHHRKSLGGSQKRQRPVAAAAAADAKEEHHANGAAAECSLQEEVPLRASYNRGLDKVCLHLEGATPPEDDASHESNGFDMEQLKLPIGAQFLDRADHNLHRMGAELI